jgi:hypothetical protein
MIISYYKEKCRIRVRNLRNLTYHKEKKILTDNFITYYDKDVVYYGLYQQPPPPPYLYSQYQYQHPPPPQYLVPQYYPPCSQCIHHHYHPVHPTYQQYQPPAEKSKSSIKKGLTKFGTAALVSVVSGSIFD